MNLISALEKQSPNFRKWSQYMAVLPTHDRFIAFGWLWTIGAALQRRVWMDTEGNETYANNYMLFVAPPSVGKTNVVKHTKNFFESQYQHNGGASNGELKSLKKELLYPISADSTSYEAFVHFTASNSRSHTYDVADGADNARRVARYIHCSPAFILDEASSIFKKDEQSMATFLLQGWTCSSTYHRQTLGRGDDIIKNLCVNLVGGIQPGKLAELSRMSVIDNGFSRRCLMIYAAEPNKRCAFINHTKEQLEIFYSLTPYIRSLYKLYGQVKLTPEAYAWMVEMFETQRPVIRNKHQKLTYYYPTKHQHVKKLAMAIHFSDSSEMLIGVEPFKLAAALLDAIEPDMHYAYVGLDGVRTEVMSLVFNALKEAPSDGLSAEDLYVDVYEKIAWQEFLELLADNVRARKVVQNESQKYQIRKG